MEKDRTLLRTYTKVWNYERKIYSIDNIKLAVPVAPSELAYFSIGAVLVYFVGSIIPGFISIPVLVRYILLPYLLMKFMTKKKLDGKLPHKFLIGYIEYLFLPKTISRFQAGESFRKGHFTPVVYRPGIREAEQKKNKRSKENVRLSG